MITIAVDAMGGDNAPEEIVKGAVRAVNDKENLKVILTGPSEIVKAELAKYQYKESQVEVLDCKEIIATDEPPVMAIKKKKDSSLVKGLELIKKEEAAGFVSAGSSGAILVGGQIIAGRIKGVERAPLASMIPTKTGMSLLIDCGANVDARPSHLVQFAKMGSVYMENIVGIKNPKVGILNIGAEEEKGNQLVKETFPLLKNCPDINFIGSVEARDVPLGGADIVVSEAFAGNVLLKTYEGAGAVLLDVVKGALKSDPITMLGALLIQKSLKKTLKKFSADQYGGAPLLGLKGLVMKTHGNATEKEVYNSIMQCMMFADKEISKKISEKINLSV